MTEPPRMTPEELKKTRIILGLKPGELAKRLYTKRRTYQDWEAGKRPISGACKAACELLLEKDRWMMDKIKPGFVPTRLREQEDPHGSRKEADHV